MFGSLSPEPFVVKQPKSTRFKEPTLICDQVKFPRLFTKPVIFVIKLLHVSAGTEIARENWGWLRGGYAGK
jgi:hypothetical protein